MKVYFIDEFSKRGNLLKLLEEIFETQIVFKNTFSFRATKNDWVIVADFNMENESNECLKKYENLIAIVNDKSEKTVGTLAKEYNAKDVIYAGCEEEYIFKRIVKFIKDME